MNSAAEGLPLGTKLIITILLATVIGVILRVGISLIQQRTGDISKINNNVKESDFTMFSNNTVSGYDLWDECRTLAGRTMNGQFYQIHIRTKTADIIWTADKPIGEVVNDTRTDAERTANPAQCHGMSDDTRAVNYVAEDAKFHCEVIRSNGKTGDIIGILAEIELEDN